MIGEIPTQFPLIPILTERNMPSLEASVKDQFAKVFAVRDWRLFKDVADINFNEAAKLKKSSFSLVPQEKQLLIRNIRKRLLIGIGSELIVKAIYLKSGYCINKPLGNGSPLKLPFKFGDAGLAQLDCNDTYTFDRIIKSLPQVITLSAPAMEGLKIAKVFRNKEGHVVTQAHRFDPESYRAIEATLVEIYALVFGEKLTLQFSFAHGEKGVFLRKTIDAHSRQNPRF